MDVIASVCSLLEIKHLYDDLVSNPVIVRECAKMKRNEEFSVPDPLMIHFTRICKTINPRDITNAFRNAILYILPCTNS